MSNLVPATPACRLVLMFLLVHGATALEAQGRRVITPHNWQIDSVIARFEADVRAGVVQSLGSDLVFDILDLPGAYTARKDSLLDGLERLATSGDRTVRQTATFRIALAGETGRAAPPVPGVLPRLLRIYRGSAPWLVRSAITDRMPMQADRRGAAAFLRSLAAEADSTNTGMGPHGYFSHGDPRTEALARLAEMGEEGRAVLQAMHRGGEARSPQARVTLENMARRGFPVRDAARRP